ncbi:hypothetical protein LTR53_008539 [Teratosphaeriaceae sp. CCFEE 6253]|nr:hypothetical protein LTR53_003797 [Teratosphaeriaceae sp. CCFEE 6253]KAK3113801.1 hypothetical protein LTR53_008539 [Teratosphaeriaceae sp. CCFEE 6253]
MAKDWEFTSYTKTYHREQYPAIDPKNPANSAKGKVVVVTGGGSGVGFGIANAFVEAGAKAVAILGRRKDVLEDAKGKLEAAGSSKILTFPADVSDEEALNDAFASVKAEVGPVDVAVANAAYVPWGALLTVDVNDWWKGFEVNLKGTLLTYRAFEANRSSASPTFISINTGFGHMGPVPGVSSYGISKLGTMQLVSWLAKENPEVRAVSYHPGVIATSQQAQDSAKAIGLSNDDMSLPAGFAVWLTTPRADFTNGRMWWAHWDVEELEAVKDQILKEDIFVPHLKAFPDQTFAISSIG